MENIALTDSNDDLTDRVTEGEQPFRFASRSINEQQQHVASELQDAANTDVTKGRLIISIREFLFSIYFFSLIFSSIS